MSGVDSSGKPVDNWRTIKLCGCQGEMANPITEIDKYAIHFYIADAYSGLVERDEAPAFEGVFGETSELRLLEKLISMPTFEFSVTELAKAADLTRLPVYRVIRKFEDWGVVRSLPRGKRVRYQLNNESPLVRALYDLNHALIQRIVGDSDMSPSIDSIDLTVRHVLYVEYLQGLAVAANAAPGSIVGSISLPKPTGSAALA